MKKLIAFIFSFIVTAAFAVDVDEKELASTEPVVFVNYEGQQQRIYPAATVEGIGAFLGDELGENRYVGRYATKYSAIHAYDEEQSDKLGADIIIIERDALVNHVDSVRLILAGFLKQLYGYNAADAALLAVFVTYYNAVHRGSISYFSQNYQTVVLDNIDETNVGMSTLYSDWPGMTRIIIPLTDRSIDEDIRALDTTRLTDPEVVRSLQQQEDRGVEERKDMTDLKEREVAKSKEEIEEQKSSIAEKEDQIQKDERELQGERRRLEEQEKKISKEQQKITGMEDGSDKEVRKQEIEQRKQELEESKAREAERAKSLEQDKEEVSAEKEEIAEEEGSVKAKEQEISEDKESIKRDERINRAVEEPESVIAELEAKEKELAETAKRDPIAKGKLYYLKVKQYLTDGHYANDLYMIDALTGEYIGKAPERPHIAGHKYDVISETGVLVLTQGVDREAHHLSILDLDTLEPIIINTQADIYHLSFIEPRGDYIYAINFTKSGEFRLGKYDKKNLSLLAESEDRIDKNTAFHMSGSLIFVNRFDKKMLVLSSEDLSARNVIDLP